MIDIFKKKLKLYKKVFESPEGKEVLLDLYKVCRIDQLSYVENSSHKTSYNEGVKFVAHYIKNTLRQSDQDIDKMLDDQRKSNLNNKLLQRSN
jgi:hypothetical protein